jgi:hypothetical protein
MELISNIYYSPSATSSSLQNESSILNDESCDLKYISFCKEALLFDDLPEKLLETKPTVPSIDESDESKSTDNQPSLKRVRLSLSAKKEHVERFLLYRDLNQLNNVNDPDYLLSSFIAENNSSGIYYKLNFRSVSRWLAAYSRGDYSEWGAYNKPQSKVVDRWRAARRIDNILLKRDPNHAVYNQIVVSPSLPEEYGVVARKHTPSGSFLGYYKGEVLLGQNDDTRNHDYTFAIGRNKFVDASDSLSCFARYYNCATHHADQNVAVERLSDWTNPQKAICFIANRDIAKGEEFLVSYGADYWINMSNNLPHRSRLKKACAKLSDKDGYSLFTPLYSVEAPSLAADFLDDVSESEEDDDSDFTL